MRKEVYISCSLVELSPHQYDEFFIKHEHRHYEVLCPMCSLVVNINTHGDDCYYDCSLR